MDSTKGIKLRSYAHWDLYLHPNQYHLGHMYSLSNHTEASSLFYLDSAAMSELWAIGSFSKRILQSLVQPDQVVYSTLSATHQALAVHIIPRYRSERRFNDLVFIDELPWNEFPSASMQERIIDPATFEELSTSLARRAARLRS